MREREPGQANLLIIRVIACWIAARDSSVWSSRSKECRPFGTSMISRLAPAASAASVKAVTVTAICGASRPTRVITIGSRDRKSVV